MNTSSTSKPTAVKPVVNDFDLNVVDEALLDPEKPEYVDHFGFTVQVKSDHESDTSDSDEDEFEDAASTKNSSDTPHLSISSQDDNNSTIPIVTQQQDVKETEPIATNSSNIATDNTDNAETLSTDLTSHNNNEDWQMISSIEKLGSNTTTTTTSASENDNDTNRPTHSPTPSTTSYYDLLLSKFTRSGYQNSSKQAQLQQETSHNLEQLREQSSRGDIDWGKNY